MDRATIPKYGGGILSLLFVMLNSSLAGQIIYVDADAPGANTGANWTDAYRHLQDALTHVGCSCQPVEIRVAQGVYRPDRGAGMVPADRQATFQLRNKITLKGGYAGYGQADPNDRDITAYETILSGDLEENDTEFNLDDWESIRSSVEHFSRDDNSYSVVNGSGTDATAVLDGFTITAGHANIYGGYGPDCGQLENTDDTTPANNGGGMYISQGSPSLICCTFRRNTTLSFGSDTGGGGMYNLQSHPALEDCRFVENIVFSGDVSCRGAGMLNIDSNPNVSNCTFEGNIATGFDDEYYGGGMCNESSSPSLTHCSFMDNMSLYAGGTGGGAIYSSDNSQPVLTDCYFAGNSGANGGAIVAYNIVLHHCTFYKNVAGFYGGAISGGGELRLVNCTFRKNRAELGGAIHVWHNTHAILEDCLFTQNTAANGAGMDYHGGDSELTRCIFRANIADCAGGGIYNEYGRLKLAHCLFMGNSANGNYPWAGGGAMFNYKSNLMVAQCTFSANVSANGNALACYSYQQNEPSDIHLTNCILWDGWNEIWNLDNSAITITYSDIRGGWSGQANIDADPLFSDPGDWDKNGTPNDPNDDYFVEGDYHLQSQAGRWNPVDQTWVQDEVTSPGIDAGDPATPIGWEPFPNGGIVNMGAYGGTNKASKSWFGKPNCETPIAGDINGDCIVDMRDLGLMANHWLEIPNLLGN